MILGLDISTSITGYTVLLNNGQIAEIGHWVKRGTKAKEQVMNFLIDNEPDFTVQYGRTGKPKPYCYDQADSLIIARAGFECLKEKLE